MIVHGGSAASPTDPTFALDLETFVWMPVEKPEVLPDMTSYHSATIVRVSLKVIL